MTSSISSPPTAHANSNDGIDTNAADKIAKKAQKKARLKEVKGRLRKETLKELKPILVGTSAMLCSTLCNQGECQLEFVAFVFVSRVILIGWIVVKLPCIS